MLEGHGPLIKRMVSRPALYPTQFEPIFNAAGHWVKVRVAKVHRRTFTYVHNVQRARDARTITTLQFNINNLTSTFYKPLYSLYDCVQVGPNLQQYPELATLPSSLLPHTLLHPGHQRCKIIMWTCHKKSHSGRPNQF